MDLPLVQMAFPKFVALLRKSFPDKGYGFSKIFPLLWRDWRRRWALAI